MMLCGDLVVARSMMKSLAIGLIIMASLVDALWAQPNTDIRSSTPVLPGTTQHFYPRMQSQESWDWLTEHWPQSANVEDRRGESNDFTPEELAAGMEKFRGRYTPKPKPSDPWDLPRRSLSVLDTGKPPLRPGELPFPPSDQSGGYKRGPR
jgi:hypothetical protein